MHLNCEFISQIYEMIYQLHELNKKWYGLIPYFYELQRKCKLMKTLRVDNNITSWWKHCELRIIDSRSKKNNLLLQCKKIRLISSVYSCICLKYWNVWTIVMDHSLYIPVQRRSQTIFSRYALIWCKLCSHFKTFSFIVHMH